MLDQSKIASTLVALSQSLRALSEAKACSDALVASYTGKKYGSGNPAPQELKDLLESQKQLVEIYYGVQHEINFYRKLDIQEDQKCQQNA